MRELPIVIINIIFEYAGIVKERKGKYMKQINTMNPTYNCIKQMMFFKKSIYNIVPHNFVDKCGDKCRCAFRFYIYTIKRIKLNQVVQLLKENERK